jgi:hypothetical protein
MVSSLFEIGVIRHGIIFEYCLYIKNSGKAIAIPGILCSAGTGNLKERLHVTYAY